MILKQVIPVINLMYLHEYVDKNTEFKFSFWSCKTLKIYNIYR